MLPILRNGEKWISKLRRRFERTVLRFNSTFVTARTIPPKRTALNFSVPKRAARALDAWGKLSRVIPRRLASRYFWRLPELTHFLRFSLVLSRAPPREVRGRARIAAEPPLLFTSLDRPIAKVPLHRLRIAGMTVERHRFYANAMSPVAFCRSAMTRARRAAWVASIRDNSTPFDNWTEHSAE